MKAFNLSLAVCLLAMSAATSRVDGAFPYHTFDTDGQGWQYAGAGSDNIGPTAVGGLVDWDASGSLLAGDVYYCTWIAAPAAFLGNQSDMYGRSFTYDILIRYTDDVDAAPVCIQGAGLSLIYWAGRPPLGVWQTRTVTFDESQWRVSTFQGVVATREQLQSVLADLTGLFLQTEWRTGPDSTSIDNVGQGTAGPVVTASGSLSGNWLYQNTPVTTAGRHLVYLTVGVTGSTNFTVGVTRSAASLGDVTILATANPLVWAIVGSQRQPGGAIGTGAVTLDLVVTDTPSGAQGLAQVNLTCRQLGDLDGVGGVNGQDKLLINKRLSGLVPNGPEFDLDCVGGCNGQDKLILNKILSGIAIP